MGFLVGLHTAGIVPWRLGKVLPLVDWVAMDLKARFDEHEDVTRVRGSGERARQSRDLIMKSGVACELHTLALDAPHARIDAAGAQV
jgi:pyruvate formate lyase activating enzyme